MFDTSCVQRSCRAARFSVVPFASLVALVLIASLDARADVTWTLLAGQSGDWSIATNWNGGRAGKQRLGLHRQRRYRDGHVAGIGSTLTVPAGQGFGGSGSIADPVSCQGAIAATSGASINLSGELTLSGSGTINLGFGNLTTNDTNSSMNGGYLSAGYHYLGSSGTGTFTQSGGSNSSGFLYIAVNTTDRGNYVLDGGYLNPSFLFLGTSGSGNVTQSGGTCSPGFLYIAINASGSGTYIVSGSGQFSSWIESVGENGSGSFIQSGGSNTVTVSSDRRSIDPVSCYIPIAEEKRTAESRLEDRGLPANL